MIIKVIDDTRGELIYGAFWLIWGWLKKEDVMDRAKRLGPERMIVTGSREWFDSEIFLDRRRPFPICPVDRKHSFASVIEEATYLGDEPENTATLYPAANKIVVPRRIAARIEEQRFKGLSIINIGRSDQVNDEGQKLEQVALLEGTPKVIARRLRTVPEGIENACYNCGYGPITCLVCNDGYFHCPKCEVPCSFAGTIQSPPTDPEFKEAERIEGKGPFVFLRDEDCPVVLDGALWDGEDAMLGGITRTSPVYTRRFLDFLLGMHLDQIAALTVPVYVGDCTAEQKKRIRDLAGRR